ncbi:magnesium transporter [Lachnoclostridium phytofermentans]|uniref:Magnesium transporter MgtE n=1 Tax=Lachnoclostridium phytofermentans (strain ATCC 700394 / DSM 18823 / ISDg) TaxID=357809 RepID=A9KQ61_LACP7|nr:magnesium transporter [Lachnoclostridium phytofermentans]ABX43373.1 magnesium transporter [Lachnoclostridium phytofermentans ISDg]
MQDKVLELLENKSYSELKHILETMNSADIAQILSEVKNEDMILLYRFLTKDTAVETFSYMETELQERLIHAMTDKELRDVTSELFLDDTVDLIEEMPANIVKRILQQAQPDQRKLINEFLKYPSDSAGSVMTIEFIDLKATMTVDEAFAKIRKIGLDKETIYTCYVLDDSRRLQGIVTVKDLLLAKNDTILSDIMETNLITVNTHDDKEVVARKFDKYDFLALPVVDQESRLVGIITIDDAIDVIQDENTEDFERMAALSPSEDSYFRTSVFQHAKNRIVWLLALMLSATVTGVLITRYENAFKAIPLLVAFIPMLMDTGGNCGSQTSTLIIRGMALDEIRSKDILRVLYKEIRVALLVGVMLGSVNGIRIFIQYHDLGLALVVGLTLVATVCLSKVLGCLLPMVAKVFKMDPALMAAPLITTIVDTCSIMIYFSIALRIMNL